MTRHAFTWQGLTFGLLFLVIAGNWMAWQQDAFSIDQFAVAAPLVLIIIGLAGIVASVWRNK